LVFISGTGLGLNGIEALRLRRRKEVRYAHNIVQLSAWRKLNQTLVALSTKIDTWKNKKNKSQQASRELARVVGRKL
jgi:hypothetical protein